MNSGLGTNSGIGARYSGLGTRYSVLGARCSRLGTSVVVALSVVASSFSWTLHAQSPRPRSAPVKKDDVNRRNVDGSTPLQWAVYNGDLAEARRLLKAGADVSLANRFGATLTTLAAEMANTYMHKLHR